MYCSIFQDISLLSAMCRLKTTDICQVLDVQHLNSIIGSPAPWGSGIRQMDLGDLLTLHGFDHPLQEAVKPTMDKGEADIWLKRPLPEYLLKHAKDSIPYLAAVAAKQLSVSSLSLDPSNPDREVVLAAIAASSHKEDRRVAARLQRLLRPKRRAGGRFIMELVEGVDGLVIAQMTPAETLLPDSQLGELKPLLAYSDTNAEPRHYAPTPSSDVESLIAILPDR